MQADNAQSYGSISRFFHWLMAAGFAFMLFTALSWLLADDAEWTKGLMYYHKSVGFLLAVLVVLRLLWALANLKRRPPADSMAALFGHIALYVLMVAVPFIGLIRQYGGARGALEVFGATVMQGSPEKIDWMVQLGGNWHSTLAWVLFALAAGHIAMVAVHRLKGEDVLPRMLGR
ncbi:cytochrome b/b6 domain-containing protein [Uruburuella testudinis]|uniref:Cytochrome b/b6 domain-containing protein n=1 Tax=Uruburuella testudinis TaxID=1282863 RepID=A0ABY4DV39_9NEIS|nr:cytochrome b/b6 domain-containing protein [Uruburuella testudinis]UOO81879.1 cytochrome b/b6 domain-containing protein [Uruburuella testudinis]